MNKALRRAGEGKHDFWEIYPFLPTETRGYVPAFIAANYIMTYHKCHNISPALAKRPLITDTIHITKRVHFDQISQVMDIPVEEIRALNPSSEPTLFRATSKPYSLVLPSLQGVRIHCQRRLNTEPQCDTVRPQRRRRTVVGSKRSRDARGEYYDEQVTKWHTVRKGETLTKIANKYGITIADIRKHNRVKKSVKAGQKLKIVTTQRTYKPQDRRNQGDSRNTTQSQETPATQAPATDSTATQCCGSLYLTRYLRHCERRTGKGSRTACS